MKQVLILFINILLMLSTHQLSVAQSITFNKNIAPIVFDNCVPCHRESGNAPFSLVKYQDVAKRAAFVGYVTQKGIMPPWKANPHYSTFAGQRVLTAGQIDTIQQWIIQGAKEGFKKDLPKVPVFSKGSQIKEKPDAVLSMKIPVTISGDNKAVYVCYKIPFEFASDTFVRCIEFVPGLRGLVHHASYQVLAVDESVNVNESPSYFVYGDSIKSVNDAHDFSYFKLIGSQGQMPKETYHGGWLPGVSAQQYPQGMGFRLPKKGVLMIRNLHYSPSPTVAKDVSFFNIFFAKVKTTRNIEFAAFQPKNTVSVIPKDSIKKFYIILKIGADLSLLHINPHMHLLGKNFKAYAIAPNLDTIPLIEIKDWDFEWQDFYRFPKLLKLPKGSILHAEATFDNTAQNVHNPSHPPKDALFETGSMEDTEEMMRLVFLYLPYKNGDENIVLE